MDYVFHMPDNADVAAVDRQDRRLLARQVLTAGLMVVGYSGYYLCRSNLSVALPLIVDDVSSRGGTAAAAKLALGAIVSAGILAYAIGKPFAGTLADFLGGRGNYLLGMAGAIVMTLGFAAGASMPVFAIAWVGNRFAQSLGWAGIIKVTSRWFGYSSYGAVMGVISLSYLFGDAAARAFLGFLIGRGLGWRELFVVAASTLLVIFVANLALLKETPADAGLPEPPTNPENLYGERGDAARPTDLRSLLIPLARRPAFWLICLLSLGLTMIREAFNTWTPTYFVESVGLGRDEAASASALFPVLGGISVLLAGFLGDRLGRGGRAAIILVGSVLAGCVLIVLGCADFGGSQRWPVTLVAAVALCMIGPYSYLAGAVSLDLGGKQGSATASGIVDFAGYLGAVLAGWGVARISLAYGWTGAFLLLAAVAWVSGAVAAVYYWEQRQTVGSEALVAEVG
jgi:OPA family glycerol-3-phosphate transporter-like MFS transporter